jgi:hypothetical protein
MWIAIVMRAMADIDHYGFFQTEAEADTFGVHHSSPGELDPDDDPDHWQKYDPPIVIVLKATARDAMETGKYDHPVAIYQRGVKFRCMPPSE